MDGGCDGWDEAGADGGLPAACSISRIRARILVMVLKTGFTVWNMSMSQREYAIASDSSHGSRRTW